MGRKEDNDKRRGGGSDRDRIEPGTVLAEKYRVDGLIGKGGMAIVVIARHIELGQRVAIKLLPEKHLKDAELVERFMREAKAVSRLRTEHAVKVSDVGRLKDGVPFMVMELLAGEDLGRVISRQPLSVPSAVECILQACEAIAEAHGLGIVHRDIKPKNLFLLPRHDNRPFIKVLDFGLAKHVDVMEDAGALTATTAVLGSPHYMSPEQMRASKNVDARADIWSLGVCLYELLTGRPPFPGETVAVVCAAVLKQPPTPLSAYLPNAPPQLWAIIQRCLEKDAARRYPSVAALVEALIPFAPPHAQAAAHRIGKLLRALPTMVVRDPTRDTHTGATLDSDANYLARARRSKWVLPISLFVGSIVIAGTAIGLAIRFRPQALPAVAPASREPAQYIPDPPMGLSAPSVSSLTANADGGGTESGETTPINEGQPRLGHPPAHPLGGDHGSTRDANVPRDTKDGGVVGGSSGLKLGPSQRL